MNINTINQVTPKELKVLLTNESLSRVKKIRKKLDDLYYNTDECDISDEKYDIIKEFIESKDSAYIKVGAPLRSGDNRTELPFWLGSMDKIKDEPELNKWLNKNTRGKFIITEKLDGVSALLSINNGKYSMFTRGDGNVGADISPIIKYIKNIPPNVSSDVTIRGELIIGKSNFTRYSSKYSNARNMVSGIVNAKTLREGIRYIDFIPYEIINDGILQKPSTQLEFLESLGFAVVDNENIDKVDINILTNKLTEYKFRSDYTIDGLVVQPDLGYVRNNSGNPEYAFAFKVNDQESMADVDVTRVDWNISMRGMIKPTIRIRPVLLSGVIISSVTGFNAKFIVDNKICKGSVIRIVRSGDVIPHVVEVVKSGEEGELPDIPYYWGDTHVDIFVTDREDRAIYIKSIHHFLTTLGIKQVAISTLEKLYDIGITSVPKLLKAEKKNFLKADGIQEKSADRIYTNIHSKLREVPLHVLMAASCMFDIGLGVKKFKVLISSIPNVVDTFDKYSGKEFHEILLQVEGFSEITANKVIVGMPSFKKFLKETRGYIILEDKQDKKVDKTLVDKKFIFSGFRDKELENYIEDRGGSVVNSVSSKTSGVIVKTRGQETSKITKAKRLGLDILTIEEFKSSC